jgi:uncharacterized protein GlcG (DUF336 family)
MEGPDPRKNHGRRAKRANPELALRVTEAAVRQAAREGAAISVAAVDEGGNPVSFQRMAGAEISGAVLAPGEAYTSVTLRTETGGRARPMAAGDELAGLAGAGFVAVTGGVPLWADHGEGDRVAGGAGVGGGTPAQDVACAEAAALVWRTR